MDEDIKWKYWHSILDARAALGTDEDWLTASQLVSIETAADQAKHHISVFIKNNFPEFLRLANVLSDEDRFVILSTHLLSSSQRRIGDVLGCIQTRISTRLKMLTRCLAYYALCEGEPTPSQVRAELLAAGLSPFPADVMEAFEELRDTREAAMELGTTPQGLHKAMVDVTAAIESIEACQRTSSSLLACGAYLSHYAAKHLPAYMHAPPLFRSATSDPAYLGEFRIRLEDADLDALFAPKSRLADDGD